MTPESVLLKFGFKFGKSGAHAARTMMLGELQQLFARVPPEGDKEAYRVQIVDMNALDKPTLNARRLTFSHMLDMYGLTPEVTLFRVFRRLWGHDERARPLLTLQMAMARDPIFRMSRAVVLGLRPGAVHTREAVEAVLAGPDPDRFSPASLKSIAQSINGSWTQAGFLEGRSKKHRTQPLVAPANVAFALFQAWLTGVSGQRLFSSEWLRLLDSPQPTLVELARVASQHGLITFRQSSEVIDVDFPGYLTEEEKGWLYE